jgi:hypothetical protein
MTDAFGPLGGAPLSAPDFDESDSILNGFAIFDSLIAAGLLINAPSSTQIQTSTIQYYNPPILSTQKPLTQNILLDLNMLYTMLSQVTSFKGAIYSIAILFFLVIGGLFAHTRRSHNRLHRRLLALEGSP